MNLRLQPRTGAEMNGFISIVDQLNTWIGKAFAWCIVFLTFAVCYEVVSRYAFGAPTWWAFDVSWMLYGALFMMAGAYTLARNGHVRGDFLYRQWPETTQAKIDLALYVLFFFPGIISLMYAGWKFAHFSWLINEKSPFSPDGIIIWPVKMLIPVTGFFMTLQGIAECLRCVVCLRTGKWPQRINDVEEMEKLILEQAEAAKAQQAGA
jgi:TRAP-type mannitol/chloroaromatic compound transport system permease small subunit